MVATQVINSDGSYQSHDDKVFFITLEPFVTKPVILIAYCVDFAKDNPTDKETLAIFTMPPYLKNFFHGVINYPENNHTAVQLVLWLAHDFNEVAIRRSYYFTASNIHEARLILRRHY